MKDLKEYLEKIIVERGGKAYSYQIDFYITAKGDLQQLKVEYAPKLEIYRCKIDTGLYHNHSKWLNVAEVLNVIENT